MDRSSLKKFSLFRRGDFSAGWTQNYSKLPEMDRSSQKNSPCLGGGFSANWTQSYLKLPEMDRSSLKLFSLLGGGFYQLNPKLLPAMDRSSLKIFTCKGVLFFQVTVDERFNDACNIGMWSYIMFCGVSRVSHHKGENRSGGTFRPICSSWGFASISKTLNEKRMTRVKIEVKMNNERWSNYSY